MATQSLSIQSIKEMAKMSNQLDRLHNAGKGDTRKAVELEEKLIALNKAFVEAGITSDDMSTCADSVMGPLETAN